MLGRHVGHDSCCCCAVSQPARRAGSAMDSQSWFSGMWAGVGWWGISFVFLRRQYATLEIRGAVLGGLVGHDPCCCSGVSEPARRAGSAMDSQSWFLVWAGVLQWTLKAGFLVCGLVSQPARRAGSAMDSQSWFSGMWAGVGWWGISFVFLRRQYATLEIRGAVLGGLVGHDPCCCSGVSEPARRAGSAMDSQSWFLVWAGVLQWTLKAGFLVCGLVSQSARRAGSAMDSQSWFSGMWAGVGWWGISFVFLRRHDATLEIRGAVLGGLVGHDPCCCSGVSEPARRAGSAMDPQSWFLVWAGVLQWTLKAGCLVCGLVSQSARRAGSAMDSQSWFSGMWAGVGWWGISFVFLRRQYATLEIRGAVLGGLVGHDPCCCSGVSEPARRAGSAMDPQSWFLVWAGVLQWTLKAGFLVCGLVSQPARRAGSAMDSQSWFLVWAGVLQWTLKAGFLVCGLVSQPARRAGSAMDSQSWFSGMWAGVGWWGISFVFLRRQYATLEIRGAVLGGLVGHDPGCCSGVSEPARRAGSAMDSQSWFLVWAGVLQWTLKAGFLVCGLVSQPARRAGSAMDSQSWFSGMWAGVGWWGISFVFLRRQYATLEIRGAVLGGLVGHDPCCCSGVSESARRAGSAMDSQSWFLVWAGVLQWTLKAGFLVCGLVWAGGA